MDILRIAALGTAGVLLGITVKGAKPEFALLVTVGICPITYQQIQQQKENFAKKEEIICNCHQCCKK